MTQTMQNNIKPFINRRKLLLSYKSLRLENARTMDGGERLRELLDEGSFEELFADLKTKDPLEFPGYGEKLEGARRSAIIFPGCNPDPHCCGAVACVSKYLFRFSNI